MFLDAELVAVASRNGDRLILACELCQLTLRAGDPVVIRGRRFAHLSCVEGRVAIHEKRPPSNLALGDGLPARFQCNEPRCGTEFEIRVTDNQRRARYVMCCPCCVSTNLAEVTGLEGPARG